MTILPNGNIGIGETNPGTILDVNGTITATSVVADLTNSSNSLGF